MTKNSISENEIELIRKLWRTPTFSGAFAGISTFKNALKIEKNIEIARNDLTKIMQKDHEFLLESNKFQKQFPRRKMNVHGFCSLWQCDLAMMFPFQNYIGFLLCIDIFSRNIYCKPLKSKSALDVRKAFSKIFSLCNDTPDVLESDQGSEFLGNKKYFLKKKIFFKLKFGRNKASFAENAIFLVKRRLFRLLRALFTQDWPRYLPYVVRALNNSPNEAIGGLKPSSIKDRTDTPLIDNKIGFHPDIPFEIQAENQKKYMLKPHSLKVGDFVYLDFKPTTFKKSYSAPNYQLYTISKIDAGKTPPMFQVKDLKGDIKPDFFYREQLLKSQAPIPGFFRIEKILKREMRGNTEFFYVKYQNYPDKFNTWVPKGNIKE